MGFYLFENQIEKENFNILFDEFYFYINILYLIFLFVNKIYIKINNIKMKFQ